MVIKQKTWPFHREKWCVFCPCLLSMITVYPTFGCRASWRGAMGVYLSMAAMFLSSTWWSGSHFHERLKNSNPKLYEWENMVGPQVRVPKTIGFNTKMVDLGVPRYLQFMFRTLHMKASSISSIYINWKMSRKPRSWLPGGRANVGGTFTEKWWMSWTRYNHSCVRFSETSFGFCMIFETTRLTRHCRKRAQAGSQMVSLARISRAPQVENHPRADNKDGPPFNVQLLVL